MKIKTNRKTIIKWAGLITLLLLAGVFVLSFYIEWRPWLEPGCIGPNELKDVTFEEI